MEDKIKNILISHSTFKDGKHIVTLDNWSLKCISEAISKEINPKTVHINYTKKELKRAYQAGRNSHLANEKMSLGIKENFEDWLNGSGIEQKCSN